TAQKTQPFFESGFVIRAVCNRVNGSVPRAVASVSQHQARSLPLAVLTRRVMPLVNGSVPRAVASVSQHQARSPPLAVLTRRGMPLDYSRPKYFHAFSRNFAWI